MVRLFFFRDVGRGTRDLGRGTRPRPRKSGRLMLRVLLYTIRCSLPPSLKLQRAGFTIHCSLFTVHQKTIRYSLLAIRSLLFTIHCLLFTKNLFAPTYAKAPAGKIHCLLFTVHQKTIRYSLLAIRSLLSTVHQKTIRYSLLAIRYLLFTKPGAHRNRSPHLPSRVHSSHQLIYHVECCQRASFSRG